ncbi:MAG: RNA polymerase sigma factor [Gaiellaceae bacterium]
MKGVEEDFRRLFAEHHRHVLAYALRRTGHRADAEDVVAGTFAVAWRRFADAPEEALRLAWLYAIAARVLANQRRSSRRLLALRSRLRELPSTPRDDRSDLPDVMAALRELRSEDQEILRLAAWEGLTNAELAIMLGCSENAAAIRLHRARKRLEERLAKEEPAAGHSVVGDTE